MNESIYKYLEVGLIHFMAYPETTKFNSQDNIVETLKKVLVDDYFNAIEITHIKDDKKREEVRVLLEQSHMKVAYGVQPRLLGGKLNPNDLDEVERKKAEKIIIESIDEAAYLGAKSIAFLAGKYEENKKNEAFEQLLKTTKNVCKYAKAKNINVSLEVFDYDVDKKSLIGPADYAVKFAAKIRKDNDNFGLLVDLSHLPQTYESSKYAIQTMKPYITHFHIGNCVMKEGAIAYGDTHPRFGFPNGSNDVNELKEFLQVMKEEGFFNIENPYVLSFEVKPWENENSEVVIANAKRTLNRAWALL
ncbi:sugar phosphate isomerase/epimerase [Clostridium sp. SHJSY1]|uniref:sugar phosphate isomerase/epimerase family protein n=1 Tax=Clostridium sp. SHJSY1 TaxID=2942483 RepID=UPI00287400E6|nr:TIM barrel protein [Clostridium sp. SHJSY1]MDS0527122.1 sugar phosphate isomerase/epimerase [Clostridium sp. SHJSY1]